MSFFSMLTDIIKCCFFVFVNFSIGAQNNGGGEAACMRTSFYYSQD